MYNESKPFTSVVSTIKDIYSSNNYDLSTLRRLCGCVVYSGVFLLPERELESGHQYSIEQMCSSSNGLITMELHDILYTMGDIATVDSEIDIKLHWLLDNCMLLDCLRFLHLPVLEVVSSLVLCYLSLLSNNVSEEAILGVRAYTNEEALLWDLKGGKII